jgi:hypothetical protein
MFTKGNLSIIAAILIVAVAAGLYMMRRTREGPRMNPMAENLINAVPERAGKIEQANPSDRKSGVTTAGGRVKAGGGETPPSGSVESQRESEAREAQIRVQDFEADVLNRTRALHVRLETPALKAWAGAGPQAYPDGTTGEAYSAPGYVAFMAEPQAVSDGIYHTMADIARNYFDAFPQAPRVTVSLIVGGGVRDRETFFSNGDGTVRVGGE